MEIFYPTKEAHDAALEQSLERLLKKLLPPVVREAHSKDIYTIDEACDFLSCSRRHIHYLYRESRQLNYIKNGKKIYFRREDLEKFFEDNYIEVQSA